MWTTVFSISEQKQKRKPTRTRQNPPTDLATKCKSSVKNPLRSQLSWYDTPGSRLGRVSGLTEVQSLPWSEFSVLRFFLAEESTSHGPENRTLGLRLVLERGRCLIVVSVHSSSIRKTIILIYLKNKKKTAEVLTRQIHVVPSLATMWCCSIVRLIISPLFDTVGRII